MDLPTFRARVRDTFGDDLQRATGDSVRAFIRRVEAETRGEPPAGGRYDLGEDGPVDVSGVFKRFFTHVLDLPAEEAMVALWLVAADLAFADDDEELNPGSALQRLESP